MQLQQPLPCKVAAQHAKPLVLNLNTKFQHLHLPRRLCVAQQPHTRTCRASGREQRTALRSTPWLQASTSCAAGVPARVGGSLHSTDALTAGVSSPAAPAAAACPPAYTGPYLPRHHQRPCCLPKVPQAAAFPSPCNRSPRFFPGDVSSAVAVSHCMSRAATALNTAAHASSSSSPAPSCSVLDSDADPTDSSTSLGGVNGPGDAILQPIALPALPPSWRLSHSACVARSCQPAASVLAWVRVCSLFVVFRYCRCHFFVICGERMLGPCLV
jgi:hypothetical protein